MNKPHNHSKQNEASMLNKSWLTPKCIKTKKNSFMLIMKPYTMDYATMKFSSLKG